MSALGRLWRFKRETEDVLDDLRADEAAPLVWMRTRAESATYTATLGDQVILATGGAGGITINLPAAATATYKTYVIKKVDSGGPGAVTIDPAGAEKVDGAATLALAAQYDSVMIVCDGTNWFVVADYP